MKVSRSRRSMDYDLNVVQKGVTIKGMYLSMVPCPVCGIRMLTDHKGLFRCESCGREDIKNVKKYTPLGGDSGAEKIEAIRKMHRNFRKGR